MRSERKDWIPKLCPRHRPHRYSSAVDAAEDADERTARGETQTWCEECKRWYWPHEVVSNYDSAPTDPHHGGKIWKP